MKRITPKHELTIKERKELLLMPTWSCEEVMKYTGFAKSKSFQIMNFCKEKLNGKVMFNDHKVKRDSVLAYLDTSIEREKYIIKQLEELENK